MRRDSQVRTLTPTFTVVVLQIWRGGGSPISTPSRQSSPLWLEKFGLTKSPKMVIFGINLNLRKYPAVYRKKTYRCTTTNLPLCNCAVIALQITALHSVSVITKFVIRKRDKKQTKTKHHTCLSTAGVPDTGARRMIPTTTARKCL